jgi:hypothetical protein
MDKLKMKKINNNGMICCDTSTVQLEDIFPNPTEQQIELWNNLYDDGKLEGVLGTYYFDIIRVSVKESMLENLNVGKKNVEVK